MSKCRYCDINFEDLNYKYKHEMRHEIRAIMKKMGLTEDEVRKITKEYRSIA